MTRDDVLNLVELGELTPAQAEAWARKNGQPPFETQPNSSDFDPMSERYWTLAMAAAWIIWRKPEAVREFWDGYRGRYWHRLRKPREPRKSPRKRGWRLVSRAPPSPDEVLIKAAQEDREDNRLHALEATHSLIDHLEDGKLVARGIPHGQNRHVDIDPKEWIDFRPFDFHVAGEHDSIAEATATKPAYDKVRVLRTAVLELWPIGGSVAAQAEDALNATQLRSIEEAQQTPPGAIEKAARTRPGPKPGTNRRYASSDREHFPEVAKLMLEDMTLTGATEKISSKLKGGGTDMSKARRLARLYKSERPN
jgi:hypothetical protein